MDGVMVDRLLMDFSIIAVPGFQNRMQNLEILFSSREPMTQQEPAM
jgi:hypothetical protein